MRCGWPTTRAGSENAESKGNLKVCIALFSTVENVSADWFRQAELSVSIESSTSISDESPRVIQIGALLARCLQTRFCEISLPPLGCEKWLDQLAQTQLRQILYGFERGCDNSFQHTLTCFCFGALH